MTIRRYASRILALLIVAAPLQAQQQAGVRVPASVLERYVGEYVYPNGNIVAVRLCGDSLIRVIGGQQMPYVPVSESVFWIGPVFTAEFVTDQAGGVTQVVSDGVAVEYRLRRKGSPPAPPERRAVPDARVPRSVLERYVGVYDYIPGQMKRTDLTIVVRLRGDTLTRDMGQGETALVPITESRFRVGGTSLVVEFVTDEAGVTQVLGSGVQQMLARLRK
jgi:hypothetical protein